MKITPSKLVELNACEPGLEMFKTQFGAEAELKDVILWAIENGMEAMRNANWLIVRMMERKQCIYYAIYAAKQILPIYETKYPEDKRPRLAIEAAEACAAVYSEENKAKALHCAPASFSAADYDYADVSSAANAASDYASPTYSASYCAARAAAYIGYAAADYADYASAYAAAYYAACSARNDVMINILRYGLSLIEK
jgi:hypothetical protein